MSMYLGRDAGSGEDIRIDTDKLCTHGIVVGMTGSGKTGLSVVVLEELVLAGVPIIAIDPKGDLGSLSLVFPGQSAAEFEPWVDGDAAATAARWQEGLAGWGIAGSRLAELRNRLDLTLYTPGSEAGVPVDVVGAFRRPADLGDADARRDLVSDTVSGLLGLVGRAVDPVKDPAHIVLSQILDQAWEAGEDPDLETLVLRLVDPPFQKIGVFPLDRFYKPDDRMGLAMELNGILASPAFAAWATGTQLDIGAMLARGDRTPVHIFNLAHLSDTERSFFVSLLLGRVQAWSRSQPGSSDLRALLFFDEVAGFLPPHPANPPAKKPLLTIMKQARAVGLGVVLATQNPVDLDYKASSNAGLWCSGRLQTRQDRTRLLGGLGAPEADKIVEGLDKRQFMLHLAGAEPLVLQSRWAMSFLRGPFTRAEIRRVNELAPSEAPAAPPTPTRPASLVGPVNDEDTDLLPSPPPCPVNQWFLDPRVVFSVRLSEHFGAHAELPRGDGMLVHRPALYAELILRFDDARAAFLLDHRERRVYFPLHDGLPGDPVRLDGASADLLPSPPDGSLFAHLPTWMDEERELKELQRQVVENVFRTETRGMFVNSRLKLYGRPQESREDFDARAAQAVQDLVDADTAKLRDRYEREAERIDDQIAKKEARISELESALKGRQVEEAVNAGELIWSLFGGRKKSVSTAMTKRRMTMQTQERLERTSQELAELQSKAYELENQLALEIADLERTHGALLDQTTEAEVRLDRSDITVAAFGVLWVPVTRRI